MTSKLVRWKDKQRVDDYLYLLHCSLMNLFSQQMSILSLFVFSWVLHCLQTAIHILQVTLGYMLMLCVMSYNVWIFLGVIMGSVLGYFLAFPLLNHI